MGEENGVPDSKEQQVPNNGLPEEWKDINFSGLFAKGWKPRIKKKGDKQYITLRNSYVDETGQRKDPERSLGPFESERWDYLLSLVPKKTFDLPEDQVPKDKVLAKSATKMLSTNIARHKLIPSSISLDTDILEYYEWFQRKGYDKPLDVWIHESLRNYFIQNGLGIGVVIRPIEEVS